MVGKTDRIAAAFVVFLAGCGAGGSGGAPLVDLHTIESPAAAGSAEPNLFAAPDGRVYLSWMEAADSAERAEAAEATEAEAASSGPQSFSLRFASLQFTNSEGDTAAAEPTAAGDIRPGVRWSEPRTISTSDRFFVNWADFPSLIQLPDGSLAAHWPVRHGSGAYGYHVHVARSSDGGRTWSEDVVLHRDTSSTEHGFVSLFPWRDGKLAAVWLDGRKFAGSGDGAGASRDDGVSGGTLEGGPATPHGASDSGAEMTLRFTTIGAGGALGAELLLDGRVCDCCQTDAALTANGPVVVYRDRSAREIRDIHVIRYVDNVWTQPVPVHRDGWLMPACPVNGPAVAANGRRVAVAWFTAADNEPRVLLAFSQDAGASFGTPIRVDDGSPAGRVDVISLPGGAALVSWLERTRDGAGEVRVRRVDPAAAAGGDPSRGPALTITRSSAARASGFPRMVRAGEHVIFAWTLPGDTSRVQAALAKLPARTDAALGAK